MEYLSVVKVAFFVRQVYWCLLEMGCLLAPLDECIGRTIALPPALAVGLRTAAAALAVASAYALAEC